MSFKRISFSLKDFQKCFHKNPCKKFPSKMRCIVHIEEISNKCFTTLVLALGMVAVAVFYVLVPICLSECECQNTYFLTYLVYYLWYLSTLTRYFFRMALKVSCLHVWISQILLPYRKILAKILELLKLLFGLIKCVVYIQPNLEKFISGTKRLSSKLWSLLYLSAVLNKCDLRIA